MPLMPEQAAACREWQGKGAHYSVHQAWQARRHFVICTCGPARAHYNGTTGTVVQVATSSSPTSPLPVPTMSSPESTSSVPARVSLSRAIASVLGSAGVISNLGVYGLPRITEIPEALRPLWGQLLTDAEAELSIEYRAVIQRYPFISDPRRDDLPTDEDLPTLIEFLMCRAARAHQPTPPPEEESNWPDEGEAGPSGSK
ncbi:hypothetical protein B0H14DRAFT_2626293 [Mycena olivaceomarginata]|nr:hypothetical protein B0H14DRAFT_2626293 [Mycena olivaceomarginata]